MNHSWKESIKEGKTVIQECSICGCLRQKISTKKLMCIVNHPPWQVYKYKRNWHYSTVYKTSTNRPNCDPRTTKKNEFVIPAVGSQLPVCEHKTKVTRYGIVQCEYCGKPF